MRALVGIWLVFALWLSTGVYAFPEERGPGQISSPALTQSVEVHQAEARKFEAERFKLELEAKEIERRLNSRWWEGQNLSQYLLAIIITAALLFGWTRVYLEPILRKEGELNAVRNRLLEAQYEQVRDEQTEAAKERDRLRQEAEILATEKGQLVNDRQVLESVVAGLKVAVDQAAEGKGKFFSILNSGDSINELQRSYGWKVWSDNFFGNLGYYLLIQHPGVRSGKEIVVGRTFEIDEMKRTWPKDWRQSIEKINARHGAVLALDYSYFGLLVDKHAPVGGIIYGRDAKEIKFYAPLAEWSEKLGALFQTE